MQNIFNSTKLMIGELLTLDKQQRSNKISIWNIELHGRFHTRLCYLDETDVTLFIEQNKTEIIVLTKNGLGFIDMLNLNHIKRHV